MHWLRRHLSPHLSWIIVGLTILLVLIIRIRLRDMPLERDEGEYAYAGQLILQGVPPYKLAYNMKLPGTYAAYAIIMAIFGQTPSGIHFGVALINAASILLLFLIGRKILDEATGVVAAVSFALLSTSQSVMGLAGHATHFIVLPALAGTFVLLRARALAIGSAIGGWDVGSKKAAEDSRTPQPRGQSGTPESARGSYGVLIAGVLFGLAFLMKQHGIFFGIFGGLYLAFSHIYEPRTITEIRELSGGSGAVKTPRPSMPRRHGAKLPPINWPRLFKELALYSAGFAVPYLITCFILWAAGVFPQFTFWTITYARKYAAALPSGIGNDAVRTVLDAVTGANVLLWIIPWAGVMLLAWERRLLGEHRFLLGALLICSIGTISVGFYFRQHYFITLLPVMALLTGVAVSRAIRLVKHDTTIELFVALPIFLLFGLGCLISLGGNGATWFAQSPVEVVENNYGTTLFNEARKLAESLRSQTNGSARGDFTRIAVLGSEPEIYFYSRLHSATGYIYMYPLMETHPYAAEMQQQLINEVETNKPEYIVYVDYRYSWLGRPESSRVFDHWWQNYSAKLELVETIDVKPPAEALESEPADNPYPRGHLILYRPQMH